ncbi:MAG: hypothetical protein ABS76_11185 [Pelagibacterium sp. SCN 64-44]|nr:MAG: hypothetical protein ABS76_11185 [Pelagibacterium sp. SCN 64-44]
MAAPRLIEHPILGRQIRDGNWPDLAEGTVPLLRRLIAEGDAALAAHAEMFRSEMRVIYDIYTQWFADTKRYLRDKGESDQTIERQHDLIRTRLAPYHRAIGRSRAEVWDEIETAIRVVSAPGAQRLEALDAAHQKWRDLHDCEVDQLAGLFSHVVSAWGEPALREMYEGWVIGDWFAKRYRRFDVSEMDWKDASWLLIYLGFEGHHGHLSGTARDGSIDFVETEEAVTISFAPCGSGGRSVAGEARDGMPALMDEVIGFPALQQAHDFTWNKQGVCGYCAHCCILHETLPIAKFGYPVRVTEPPTYPLSGESRCSWTVYKDLRNIPEEAYRRVGARKPDRAMPLGSAHVEARGSLKL